MDPIPIDGLLQTLGYTSQAALTRARTALDHAGLTNPRRHNIHPDKAEGLRDFLAARFVRSCGAPRCLAEVPQDGRELLLVLPEACPTCAGRPAHVAVRRLAAAMVAAGATHLLVVGGSPASHAHLRAALRTPGLQLELVDGTQPPPPVRARALAARADVIVIWGSTILPHKVSALFAHPADRPKTITVPRRSVEALADAVQAHLARRGASWPRQP